MKDQRWKFLAVALVVCASCGEDGQQEQPTFDAGHDAGQDTGETVEPAQRVVVVAENDSEFRAMLYAFERRQSGWFDLTEFPVTIGRNGLGWGLGLHDPSDIPQGEPIKQEGDGKSPMGMFALTRAWGYLQPQEVDTRMPYETASQTLICVDDKASPFYNQIIDYQAEGLPPDNLPSHEDMLLTSNHYKYTIFVAHNSPNPTAGAGSCIFLHLWADENDSTAGCTAMAEENMAGLLQWLDPAQSPILVQLTRQSYARLKASWDLPEIPAGP